MDGNKNFNTPSNVTIIVVGLIIIILTAVSLYMFPKNFEIIFGIGTILFVSLGIYVNLQALATAQSAQVDSNNSAKAAKESVDVAKDALKIAKNEAEANASRYQIEKGSFLTLKKKQFFVPLLVPDPQNTRFDETESLDALHNPSAVFLVNNGIGTATNISYDFRLLNMHDYNNLKFESDDVVDPNAINKWFLRTYHRGFPKFTLSTKISLVKRIDRYGRRLTPTKSLRLISTADQGNLSEESNPRNKRFTKSFIALPKPVQVGYLENKEGEWIRLPVIFRILSQQYFLEQKILKEEYRKTTKPELILSVYYTEEFLEHMNKLEKAKRVKRFLITCSTSIEIVPEPDDSPHDRTGIMFLCRYAIEVLEND